MAMLWQNNKKLLKFHNHHCPNPTSVYEGDHKRSKDCDIKAIEILSRIIIMQSSNYTHYIVNAEVNTHNIIAIIRPNETQFSSLSFINHHHIRHQQKMEKSIL